MWNNENKSEISCILASLILIENNIEITDKKIVNLLDFAEIKFEKYWPTTFVRLSQNFNLSELIGCSKISQISNISADNIKDLSKDKVNKKETKLKDPSSNLESEGGDMGFGLFD
nr:60S acidic ribosomal protein P1 [Cryptomonas curvata]|mmetsp:Transcript_44282/g.92598  ORF Transcript_44282/g.92598 Transcript_44282/m.92598 type:complete len:115 (-) Transcript_44282:118-462(-)